MKTRQGFVSNSSSSSFIIGVGKIKDLSQLTKWQKDNKIVSNSYAGIAILSTSSLSEPGMHHYNYKLRGNRLIVTAPVNSSPYVSTGFDISKEELYCVVCIGNNEGDEAFWNEYFGDTNYDLADREYFEDEQAAIIEMFEANELLEDASLLYGAERNG